MNRNQTVNGSLSDDGVARLETDRDGEWIETEYRDGWVGRKLMNQPDEEYKSMVHPYFQQCAHCREFGTTEMWSAGSPYCPHCEQWYEFSLPKIIGWMFDGEQPETTEII